MFHSLPLPRFRQRTPEERAVRIPRRPVMEAVSLQELARPGLRARVIADRYVVRRGGELTATPVHKRVAAEIVDARKTNMELRDGYSCSWVIERLRTSEALVHETVLRCLPWCATITAPAIADTDDAGKVTDGVAFWGGTCQPLIVVATSRLSYDIMRVTHHEIWHIAERFIQEPFIRRMDELVVQTSQVFDDPAYLDSSVERRARLYAAYADARDLGMPPSADENCVLFESVYSGDFARSVVAVRNSIVSSWMEEGAASEAAKPPPQRDIICSQRA